VSVINFYAGISLCNSIMVRNNEVGEKLYELVDRKGIWCLFWVSARACMCVCKLLKFSSKTYHKVCRSKAKTTN